MKSWDPSGRSSSSWTSLQRQLRRRGVGDDAVDAGDVGVRLLNCWASLGDVEEVVKLLLELLTLAGRWVMLEATVTSRGSAVTLSGCCWTSRDVVHSDAVVGVPNMRK